MFLVRRVYTIATLFMFYGHWKFGYFKERKEYVQYLGSVIEANNYNSVKFK